MDKHLLYMRKAIQAAEKARGKCSPNPFVGAVIVKHDKIVATGWTQSFGSDHAEVQALKKAGDEARNADMYVTLEPCSHYGKTPPCALAIIASGIKRVFIGITDPNPLVAGKGIKLLKDAGIEVQSGLLEAKIRRQLEYHLCYTTLHRPFVTLKTALSLDGKYAAEDGSSRWISNEAARLYTHKLRSQNDVILTGIQTILIDNPLLNVRLKVKHKQPLRVVLDTKLLLPLDSAFATTIPDYPSLIFCDAQLVDSPKAIRLKEMGAIVKGLALHDGHFDLLEVLQQLASLGYYSVLIESGSGLAESFLKAHLVDKCLFFYGAKIVGGSKSPLNKLGKTNINAAIELTDIQLTRLGDNFLISGYPIY
ncbi:bifunctional diaminohydroxyphosphoribosylaminopyrimidine deaminase/5-amino-6-(5-phosphoribosylamino)uracil reductase RibD [Candidatus Cloacimonadota bacterium]